MTRLVGGLHAVSCTTIIQKALENWAFMEVCTSSSAESTEHECVVNGSLEIPGATGFFPVEETAS